MPGVLFGRRERLTSARSKRRVYGNGTDRGFCYPNNSLPRVLFSIGGPSSAERKRDRQGKEFRTDLGLYEFSRPLSEEELRTLGHSDPLYFDFGSSSYEPRIAGDYQIAIFSPDERGALEKAYLPKSDPFEADRMPESQPRVSLGYRR